MTRFFLPLALLWFTTAYGVVDLYKFDDAQQEKRYRTLTSEFRCLVCQNQNLAKSDADLAGDLRELVRGMIQGGKSNAQIVDYMVARYGDFILYRPPLRPRTILLWGGPALLLLGGLWAVWRFIARTRTTVPVIDAGVQARARRLLEAEGRKS